jgi:hypothetical protein
MLGLIVARDDMHVNVGINHHQHEIVDFVIGIEALQAAFDFTDHNREFGECRGWQIRKSGGLRLCPQDQACKRHLLGAKQKAPMIIFLDETIGITKFLQRGIHTPQLTPKRDHEGSVNWLLVTILPD